MITNTNKNYLIIFDDLSTKIISKESIVKAIKSVMSSKEIIEIKKLS